MGFADALVRLGIAYDCEAALELADGWRPSSRRVARGGVGGARRRARAVPELAGLALADARARRRCATRPRTTIAPTGTISIIAGCSGGIEPLYAVAFVRQVLDGDAADRGAPAVRRARAARGGWYSRRADGRSRRARRRCAGIDEVPAEVQRRVRHRARHRADVARADAGGLPAARPQRGVEDHQLPARRRRSTTCEAPTSWPTSWGARASPSTATAAATSRCSRSALTPRRRARRDGDSERLGDAPCPECGAPMPPVASGSLHGLPGVRLLALPVSEQERRARRRSRLRCRGRLTGSGGGARMQGPTSQEPSHVPEAPRTGSQARRPQPPREEAALKKVKKEVRRQTRQTREGKQPRTSVRPPCPRPLRRLRRRSRSIRCFPTSSRRLRRGDRAWCSRRRPARARPRACRARCSTRGFVDGRDPGARAAAARGAAGGAARRRGARRAVGETRRLPGALRGRGGPRDAGALRHRGRAHAAAARRSRRCAAWARWCSTSSTSATCTATSRSRCCGALQRDARPSCSSWRCRRRSTPSRSRDFLGDCPSSAPRAAASTVTIEHLPRAPTIGRSTSRSRAAVRRLVAATGSTATCWCSCPAPPRSGAPRRPARELARTARPRVVPLHGDLPPAEQDRAVAPGATPQGRSSRPTSPRPRSPIDGVVAVIDSGLARVAGHSPWSGLPTLDVQRRSRAPRRPSARAAPAARGRAAASGSTRRHDSRRAPEHEMPEIARGSISPRRCSRCARSGVARAARLRLVRGAAAGRARRGATSCSAGSARSTRDGALTRARPAHAARSRCIRGRRGCSSRPSGAASASDGCALAALLGEARARRARAAPRRAGVSGAGRSARRSRSLRRGGARAASIPIGCARLGLDSAPRARSIACAAARAAASSAPRVRTSASRSDEARSALRIARRLSRSRGAAPAQGRAASWCSRPAAPPSSPSRACARRRADGRGRRRGARGAGRARRGDRPLGERDRARVAARPVRRRLRETARARVERRRPSASRWSSGSPTTSSCSTRRARRAREPTREAARVLAEAARARGARGSSTARRSIACSAAVAVRRAPLRPSWRCPSSATAERRRRARARSCAGRDELRRAATARAPRALLAARLDGRQRRAARRAGARARDAARAAARMRVALRARSAAVDRVAAARLLRHGGRARRVARGRVPLIAAPARAQPARGAGHLGSRRLLAAALPGDPRASCAAAIRATPGPRIRSRARPPGPPLIAWYR